MFALLAAALVGTASAVAPLHVGDEPIEGSYVVVFHKTSTSEQRDAHIAGIKGKYADDDQFSVSKTWSFMAFHGYAAKLTTAQLDDIRADDSVVEFVEAEQVYSISKPVSAENVNLAPPNRSNTKSGKACDMQLEATWGLVRTGERDLKIDGEYAYNTENLGEDIHAYIIDTGINLEHIEFEGRAIFGFNAVDTRQDDDNGHGTHVAGTVGSKSYGIAKKATLVGVRVLGGSGSGSTAGVISGVEFGCTDHKAKGNKCVANLSLGGGFSSAMNRAVDELVACGCATAVASGNEGRDACLSSPASSESVVTVNSMASNDENSYFSNYGTCTDIYAPGSGITSTWIGSQFAINTISGTSMASPHVCGIMAKIAEAESTDPQTIRDELIRAATPGKVTRVPSTSTPNLLAYSPCTL